MINPVGILVLAIGIMLVIVGFKGSQHEVLSALTNKPAKQS